MVKDKILLIVFSKLPTLPQIVLLLAAVKLHNI